MFICSQICRWIIIKAFVLPSSICVKKEHSVHPIKFINLIVLTPLWMSMLFISFVYIYIYILQIEQNSVIYQNFMLIISNIRHHKSDRKTTKTCCFSFNSFPTFASVESYESYLGSKMWYKYIHFTT